MFMLGGFTDGLFAGAHDMNTIMQGWETVKQARLETEQKQKLADAAEQDTAARKSQAAALSVGPKTASAGTDNGPYGGGDHTSAGATPTLTDKDLESVPKPTFMQKIARAMGDAPHEGKAFGGTATATASSAVPAKTAAPGYDEYYGPQPSTSSAVPAGVSPTHAIDPSIQSGPGASAASPGGPPAGGGLTSMIGSGPASKALGAMGSAISSGAQSLYNNAVHPTQPRTDAPHYLPSGIPSNSPGAAPPQPSSNPLGPLRGGQSNTPNGVQPQTALPYSGPTLANQQQQPLGQQILAALNSNGSMV